MKTLMGILALGLAVTGAAYAEDAPTATTTDLSVEQAVVAIQEEAAAETGVTVETEAPAQPVQA